MLNQIISNISTSDAVRQIALKLDSFEGLLDKYLSSGSNLKLLSVIMIAVGLILFLFWLAIVISRYFGLIMNGGEESGTKPQQTEEEPGQNGESFYRNASDTEEDTNYKEKNREAEQIEHQKRQEELFRLRRQSEETSQKKNTIPEKLNNSRGAKNDNVLDLDWKKGREVKEEQKASVDSLPSLKYSQSRKKLSELLGLIVDMLGRNVDALKISQTVMYRNMNQNSEDDILQTVEAVKDFIALCINKKFDRLVSKNKLPSVEEALYNLANGDTSLALALVEVLMDNNIEKAASLPLGEKRNEIFNATSHYATLFGTLAAVSDVHLATGAFELAIELWPQNINAWSRIGDMYALSEAENKAVWAYKQVIEMGDSEINEQQLANAGKMLSQYYYNQGESLQAAKLYNNSRGYYDSIGINRHLDRQEIEIIELIENKQREKLNDTIIAVLNNQRLAQYSFAVN